MSCAEGVLGHVEPVNIHYSCLETCKKPPQLVAAQEPSANEHRPGERFFGEWLGWVTRKCVAVTAMFWNQQNYW